MAAMQIEKHHSRPRIRKRCRNRSAAKIWMTRNLESARLEEVLHGIQNPMFGAKKQRRAPVMVLQSQ